MAISPWPKTQTRPSWVVTVKKLDNTALDITGATFTGKLRKRSTAANQKTLTVGNYSITDATAGKFTYAPAAADVDTAGSWEWQTTITISSQTYIVTLAIEIVDTF